MHVNQERSTVIPMSGYRLYPLLKAHRNLCCVGFSLIEMLVSIAVVGILATLLVGAIGKVRSNANKSSAVANLRQVGLAILLYANDNDRRLPGPGPMGLIPLYARTTGDGRLSMAIGPYLGMPEQSQLAGSRTATVEQLISREFVSRYSHIFKRADGSPNFNQTPSYMQNPSITADGRRPFGRQDGGDGMGAAELNTWRGPLTLDELTQLSGPPAEHWLICGVDQKVVGLTGGWKANTPAEPLYDGRRIQLYADSRVEFVDSDAR